MYAREFRPRAVTVAVPPIHRTARELLLKSARERMDIIAAYREAGTFAGPLDRGDHAQDREAGDRPA